MAKKKSKKTKSILFMIVLAVIVVVILGYFIWTGGALLPNKGKVAAYVNGEQITEEELSREYSRLPMEYKALLSKEDLLNQLVDKKLLLQEAKKQGISATKEDVDEQIAILESQFDSPEAFNELIAQQNLTLPLIESMIKEQLTLSKFLNRSVYSTINVSFKEISDYYIENSARFKAKEGEIHAAHILVSTEKSAQDLLALLNQGADFQTLALRESKDPSVTLNKGDLGFFSKGAMLPEFEEVAFKLKIGETSQPIQTKYGYHIIKRLSDTIILSEAQESIQSILVGTKQSEAIENYLSELRNKSTIKIVEAVKSQPLDSLTSAVPEAKLNGFNEMAGELCMEDDKPVIRRYVTSDCLSCKNVEPAFRNAVSDYDVVVKDIELDTALKTGLQKSELDILKKFNPKGAVPTYVFGCKYYRIGNAYQTLNLTEEESIFREALDTLLG